MRALPARPQIAIFAPSPLLTVTIEAQSGGGDDVHLHAGGQGVWVTRTAGELGADPIMCAFFGGEVGDVLEPLLSVLPGELRLVRTAAGSGCGVFDRRQGERRLVAGSWSGAISRHELDDLVSVACAAALGSEVVAVCGTRPESCCRRRLRRDRGNRAGQRRRRFC